jgi:hypothetical protein
VLQGNAVIIKQPTSPLASNFQTIGPNLEIVNGRLRGGNGGPGTGAGSLSFGDSIATSFLDMQGVMRNEQPAVPLTIGDADGLDLRDTCLRDTTDNRVAMCAGEFFDAEEIVVANKLTIGMVEMIDNTGTLEINSPVEVQGTGELTLSDGVNNFSLLPVGGGLTLSGSGNTVNLAVTGANDLQINGDLEVTGAITEGGMSCTCTSDMRAKEGVEPVSPANSFLLLDKLDVISYQFKPDFEKQMKVEPGTRFDGVSAQQLDEVLPQAVRKRNVKLDNGTTMDDFHTIRKEELVPHLINAIKYLGQRINSRDDDAQLAIKYVSGLAERVNKDVKEQNAKIARLEKELLTTSELFADRLTRVETAINERAMALADNVVSVYFQRIDALDKSLKRLEDHVHTGGSGRARSVNELDGETRSLRAERAVEELLRHVGPQQNN